MNWEEEKRMPPQKRGGFWYLAGPILIKWAIAVGVSTIGMFAFYFLYISKHYEEVMTYMLDMRQANLLTNRIMKEFLKYTTELEGLAALVTIPVMMFMIRDDARREGRRKDCGRRKERFAVCFLGALMALAAAIAMNGLILIGNLSQYSESYQETMKAMYAAPFVVQIASLGVLIPICEELVFRGLLYGRLRNRNSFLYAALFSSVVFGVMHINMVQMLYGFVLGLLLAYLYEKQRFLAAPILAHCVMNLFSVTATRYGWFEILLKDPRYIGGVTVGCAAVASTIFVVLQRVENVAEIGEDSQDPGSRN